MAEGEEGEDRGVERDGEEEGQKHLVWGLGQGGGGREVKSREKNEEELHAKVKKRAKIFFPL